MIIYFDSTQTHCSSVPAKPASKPAGVRGNGVVKQKCFLSRQISRRNQRGVNATALAHWRSLSSQPAPSGQRGAGGRAPGRLGVWSKTSLALRYVESQYYTVAALTHTLGASRVLASTILATVLKVYMACTKGALSAPKIIITTYRQSKKANFWTNTNIILHLSDVQPYTGISWTHTIPSLLYRVNYKQTPSIHSRQCSDYLAATWRVHMTCFSLTRDTTVILIVSPNWPALCASEHFQASNHDPLRYTYMCSYISIHSKPTHLFQPNQHNTRKCQSRRT